MAYFSINFLLGALLFLILISGFFSGSEIAMMSLNRYRLRHLVRQKNRGAIRVKRLLKRTDRLLGIILIGNTFANILASALATMIAVAWWGNIGVVIATVLLTLIILIFAEIAPKTVAAIYPLRIAFFVSIPLRFLLKVLYPIVWLANGVSNGFLRLLQVNVHREQPEHLSGEELRTIVLEAGGLIPTAHKKMVLSILDLQKVTVDDIMVPRGEVIGIDLNEPWDDILEQLETSQHTRLPVYKDTIDHVIGFVHLRSVLNLLVEEKLNKEELLGITQECYFIPEETQLSIQILNFQQAKCRSGLVVDEYGDIKGLVTLEDILEEIVGDFTTDIAAFSKEVYPQTDGSFLVDGSVSIRDINRVMQWQFPSKGPKTLSGLIIEYLEFIPPAGVCMRIAGYPIEVLQVKDNMVKTARIFPARRRL